MTKNFTKLKYLILSLLIAVAVLLPCNNLIVMAKEITPITFTSESETGDDTSSSSASGESGESASGEPGSTATGGESGGTATEDDETLPYPTFSGIPISESVITDELLYEALLDIYIEKYTGIYNTEELTTIYSDMFNDFTEINVDGKGIESLAGLEKLRLFELESFSANLNDIASFDEDIFENTDSKKFKKLSLAGNKLSSISITNLTGLTTINFSSNKLSKLDLSAIEAKVQYTTFTLNVANNNFTSLSNIILPTKRIGHINLNIINNMISEISDDYFTDKYTMHIGIQGFNKVDNEYATDTKNNVVIYKTRIPALSVQIWKLDEDEDRIITTISDSDITEEFIRLDLDVGEYYYEYLYNGEILDLSERKNDADKLYLISNDFNVLPQKVTYLLNYKGEDYETLNKVTGVVTVKLYCEEGASIMYQVNGGEWQSGNVIECNEGGTYSIKVKAVINGVESETQNIWVRTSLNLYISDGLMLVLILVVALTLFLVVVPIISKKYFKRD